MLNLYRSHVESLSRLPEFQKEEPEAAEPAVEEKAEETTAAALTEEIEQAQPEADAAPADEEAAEDDKSEDFWSKDESQLKIKLDPSQAPVGAEEEEEPAEPGMVEVSRVPLMPWASYCFHSVAFSRGA